jgi:two-component system sensor histidine kinase SenX3
MVGIWIAVAAGAGLVALAVLVSVAVSRRGIARRIGAAVVRLDDRDVDWDGRGVEAALDRLERAVQRAHQRVEEATGDSDRLAHALGAVPLGLVVCDDSGRELYRNEVAKAFSGARHGEALVEQVIEEQLRAALHGATDRRTLELFGPPRRTLAVSAAPLHARGRTTGAVAVVEDASERRRLDAVRRDFVANVSHELKTPVGALALLAETIVSEDDLGVVRRLAERMQTEAARTGRIIEDLLDLSRIEAEEAPQREPVPVHLVVAEAVERVRPLAERLRIEIVADDAPRGRTVRGDRRQLVSAIANLLDNAVKYSEPAATVDVRSRSDGEWVEIDVQDHGIGIPARDLERIFERFYRVDRARSRDTGGTGLGLAIVRHVAGNHRGEVRVRSLEGEGSVFTLRLPGGPGPVVVTRAEAG